MPKKKILLVNTNTEKAPYPVPPVGLCLLLAVLEKNYETLVFDGLFTPFQDLPGVIRNFGPHYIGLGIRNIDNLVCANSFYYIDALYENFVKPIRDCTEVPVIAGGSGFSVFPFDLLKRLGLDYGIAGEGEEAFPALLEGLENKTDVSSIPGVVTRSTSRKTFIPNRLSFDLGALPFSSIDRCVDFSPYRNRGAYAIQTKRGCGHQCVYCTYPCIEGAAYRRRPPQSIADEIEQAHERLGNVMFEFVDSTFNDPPGHAEEICREIIKRNMKVRLRTMGINPANTSRELFDLMLAAGFSQIDCTPDSASAAMLKDLGKNFTIADLEKTARLIREADLPTMWFFILGGPGENKTTIQETFAFIDRWVCPFDMAYLMAGMRIYPNTQLHRIALSEGLVSPDDSLLKPLFYISPNAPMETIDMMMTAASQKMPNCIPASQSVPSPEMMKRALEMRTENRLDEPMFRTLLRVRREMMNKTAK
jgi:hypothetical protein